MTEDLRPEAFSTDYTGRPGERTFFLQARSPDRTASYLIEKQQVLLLAEKLRDLLLLIDADDPVGTAKASRDPVLKLEAPIEPEWRVGTIGLGYEDLTETVTLSMNPVEEAAPEEPPEVEEFVVRVLLRTDQARAFCLHALAVVAEGRPICQLCGLPMDPDGHKCPASNGHDLG